MADGTRLAKIESELAQMETKLREAKEHRQSFQESINAQFAQMRELIEAHHSSRTDSETTPQRSMHRPSSSDSNPHGDNSGRISFRKFKHEIPMFNGDDVDDWLFCIEEYFDVSGTPMDQRIKIASFYMVGPAYSWYKWLICNHYTQDWGVFVQAVQ